MGKRGPRPTPTKYLNDRGSWRGKVREGEIDPETGAPSCPTWLSREAKAEWKRIAPKLETLGVLTHIDRAALAAYCQTWAEYHEATRMVQDAGPVVEMTFTRKDGSEYTQVGRNPWASVQKDKQAALLKYLQEFGLSPAARVGIVGKGEVKNEDPLAKLEADKKDAMKVKPPKKKKARKNAG